jgi:hypothetical protein
MLFDQWEFGLNRQLNITERGIISAVGRDTGQNPAAALLIHQPASAVNRIYDDTPDSLLARRPTRQYDLPFGEAFGDQHDWNNRRDLSLEIIDEQFFADPINRIDRVAFLFERDRRKCL